MGKNAVAIIPPGITLDSALAAMRGMASAYPEHTLSLGNDPEGGGMVIWHDSAADANAVPTSAVRGEVSIGVDNPGDLLAQAFIAASQQDEDAIKAMCAGMIAILEGSGGPGNYVTYTLEHPELGRYGVTVQRCAGRTPAERIAELETRQRALISSLEAEVDWQREKYGDSTDPADRSAVGRLVGVEDALRMVWEHLTPKAPPS